MRRKIDKRPYRSLAELLARQGIAFRKSPEFRRMVELLNASPALRRLVLPRTAYALLDAPRLKPRFLPDFYATYRLPESELFALFLGLKWRRKERALARERERSAAIEEAMRALPRDILASVEFISAFEESRTGSASASSACFRPRTKKRAAEILAMAPRELRSLFSRCVRDLRSRFPRAGIPDTDTILACAALGALPDPVTGALPSRDAAKRGYRERCKEAHPDSGGDQERFLELKRAYDLLDGMLRS